MLKSGGPAPERWQKQWDREGKKRQRARIEEQPEEKAMKLHAEKRASPRRGPPVVRRMLSRRQTEPGGKVFWDAKQFHRHLPSCGNASIASQPLLPGETRMRALWA